MALTTIDTYGIKDGAVQIDDIGTLAGNLTINDSGKLRVGTGLDLQLYHDGNHSYIDNHTGSLKIRNAAAGNILIQARDDEEGIIVKPDGAVELYYDNAKQLETYSSGIQCTNDLKLYDSKVLRIGTSSLGDLKLYHNGTNDFIQSNGGYLKIQTDSLKIHDRSDDHPMIEALNNGAVNLYYDNVKKFGTRSNGVDIIGNTYIADNDKISFGGSSDLLIYHSSSSGNNIYQGDSHQFWNAAGNEPLAKFAANGAVELYYDDSKKFETTSGGAKVTGNLSIYGDDVRNDNYKSKWGTGDDLQIYHDGNNSLIKHLGTGDLYIQADNGDTLYLRPKNNEDGVKIINDGAVELYFDGSKKLETRSYGLKQDDNVKHTWGNNDDLQIYHDSANNYWNANNGHTYILANGNDIYLRGVNNEDGLIVKSNGAVELYYDNSKKLATYNGGVEVFGDCSFGDNKVLNVGTGSDLQIYHNGTDSYINSRTGNLYLAPTTGVENGITIVPNAEVRLYYDNSKKFETQANGVTVTGGVYSDGLICGDNDKVELGASGDLKIYHDGSNSYIKDTGTGVLVINGSQIHINSADNSDNCAVFVSDGAAELYYNGAKKLDTISSGVRVKHELQIEEESGSEYYTLHVNSYGGLEVKNQAFKVCEFTDSSTLDFPDSVEARWGTGNDLKIYHDGSNSYIADTGTGQLKLTTNQFRVKNGANNESMIDANEGGNVELCYDNSKKFETTSGGTTVTGSLTTTAAVAVGSYIQGNTNNGGLLLYSDSSTNKGAVLDVSDHFRPTNNNVSDLGGSSYRWKKIYATDIDASGTISGAGKILQVVQVVKTDFFSTTSSNGSYSDVTGLAASITPSSSSNKILVTVSVNGGGGGGQGGWANYYKLYRGSTALGVGDDIGGNTSQSTFSSDGEQAPDATNTSTYMYLDSPSSTSSTTYKIGVSHRSTGTAYINRPEESSNPNWAYSASSTITLQEVSA